MTKVRKIHHLKAARIKYGVRVTFVENNLTSVEKKRDQKEAVTIWSYIERVRLKHDLIEKHLK